jgi:hypothetical protein
MSGDNVRPHTTAHIDADGAEREFRPPGEWVGERDPLRAWSRTPEGVTAMLDRMEATHAR